MLLITFLFISYFAIASIMAKNTSKILINGNDKNVNLYVKQDSFVNIGFTGNSGGFYDWNFENIEELNSILGENSVKDNYDWYSGIYEITFEINNSTSIEELPELNFIYKDDEKNEVIKQVKITLVEDTTEDFNYGNLFSDIRIEKGGETDLVITKDFIEIVLYSDIPVDRPLTTGYSWYLDNADMLRNNKNIKLIRSSSGLSNKEMYNLYIFKVNEIAKEDVLPALLFSLKQSSDDTSSKAKHIINLKKSGEMTIIMKEDSLKQHMIVYKNETIIVELDGNPSTGYYWYLENAEEVKASDLIDPLNLDEDNKVTPVIKGVEPGSTETFKFKFYIRETGKSDQVLPTLKFIQARQKSGNDDDDIISTAELSLKIKKENNKNPYDSSLPVYDYDKNEPFLYVESNSIVQVTVESNSSTGYHWTMDNIDDIKRSESIDYIGSSYKSNCSANICPPGTGGYETYKYRIWEVTNDEELPKILMTYTRGYPDNKDRKIIIQLKLKKSDTEECFLNGYSCCSQGNTEVVYKDNDGEWGIENDKWCIHKKEEEKKNKPLSCGKIKDYPCCEKPEVVYTDKDGDWGYENNNWCFIKTCSYTGPYPICKTTTTVVYTDSEKWGVENDKWCVICL